MGWDKQKIRLFKMLEPYSSWGNEDEEKHREAKEALCRFYDALKKCKPDKKYQVAGRSGMHMSYFPNLILVKKALMEQRYTRACHELGTLIYQEPFFQGRIRGNVLRMLEDVFPGLGGRSKVKTNATTADCAEFAKMVEHVNSVIGRASEPDRWALLCFIESAIREDLRYELEPAKDDFRLALLSEIRSAWEGKRIESASRKAY